MIPSERERCPPASRHFVRLCRALTSHPFVYKAHTHTHTHRINIYTYISKSLVWRSLLTFSRMLSGSWKQWALVTSVGGRGRKARNVMEFTLEEFSMRQVIPIAFQPPTMIIRAWSSSRTMTLAGGTLQLFVFKGGGLSGWHVRCVLVHYCPGPPATPSRKNHMSSLSIQSNFHLTQTNPNALWLSRGVEHRTRTTNALFPYHYCSHRFLNSVWLQVWFGPVVRLPVPAAHPYLFFNQWRTLFQPLGLLSPKLSRLAKTDGSSTAISK